MTARLHKEWRARVVAEYRSAALTARLSHWMIQATLPDPLLRTCLRIVADELDHAQLAHGCLGALGGDTSRIVLEAESMEVPAAPEGLLSSLVDLVACNFCLGENFAVPLFAAMRRGTTHPEARAMLDRVIRDEPVHARFGWETLDVLLEMDPSGVRKRVKALLPAWFESYRQAYAPERSHAPLTERERAAGMLDHEEYVHIYHATVADVLLPRFAKRGIRVAPP